MKGIAVETVLFAIIAVIALIIFILLYKHLIPLSTDIVSRFMHAIWHAFCKAIFPWFC